MHVLYETLPDYVVVNGKNYPIETDFREWIRFAELAEDDTVPWQIKVQLVLQWYLDEVPEDLEAAIDALGEFLEAAVLYSGKGQDDSEESDTKRAYSFAEDAGCIYSAFKECYGMNLQKISYLHWWEFRTLFDGLPEHTEIKQRMMYRTIDLKTIKDKNERRRIRKIQQQIALKEKKKYVSDYDIGDAFYG